MVTVSVRENHDFNLSHIDSHRLGICGCTVGGKSEIKEKRSGPTGCCRSYYGRKAVFGPYGSFDLPVHEIAGSRNNRTVVGGRDLDKIILERQDLYFFDLMEN